MSDNAGFSNSMGDALCLGLALLCLFGPIILWMAWQQAKRENLQANIKA